MRLHNRLLCLFSCALSATLIGCGGGPQGVRVTKGTQDYEAETTIIASDAAVIVHIDLFERIATIRNGQTLNQTFLITTDSDGVETGVLKARDSGLSERLRTAEIVEGSPKINNSVRPASRTRSEALARMYRAPAAAN
jgi:hypothetical protein